MKKRILLLLLAVIAVVCIALSACITDHVHNFGKDWKADGENHWHECSCGEKSSVGKHEFANWVVDVEATETQSGSKHADCNVCGYRLTVEIPPFLPNTRTNICQIGSVTSKDIGTSVPAVKSQTKRRTSNPIGLWMCLPQLRKRGKSTRNVPFAEEFCKRKPSKNSPLQHAQ